MDDLNDQSEQPEEPAAPVTADSVDVEAEKPPAQWKMPDPVFRQSSGILPQGFEKGIRQARNLSHMPRAACRGSGSRSDIACARCRRYPAAARIGRHGRTRRTARKCSKSEKSGHRNDIRRCRRVHDGGAGHRVSRRRLLSFLE